MARTPWVGLDVSKTWLDVVVLPDGAAWQVTNDRSGWQTLVDQLSAMDVRGIVMEATGNYHVGVLLALQAATLPATVVNPAWVHAFARSDGKRAKTDRSDAALLARYGQQKQPTPTPVTPETIRNLRDLVGCREDLVAMRVMEKNRWKVASNAIQAVHADVIAALSEQITRLDQEISALIAQDPELAARQKVVQSMPGVGPVTSAWLLAALPELGHLDRRAIASLAGLAPHPRDSGTRHGVRFVQGGRPTIRKALYQAAMSARTWNPVVKDYYTKIHGTAPHKVAVIACARRMLVWLSAMVRDHVMWPDTQALQAFRERQSA